MQPQENLQSNERIPEPTAEVMPQFDASAEHNGMYDSEEEYLAAEAAYKIEQPAVQLNTVTFAEDNPAYPMATKEDVAAMNEPIDVSAETIPESESSVELAEKTETTPETEVASTEVAQLKNEVTEEDVIDVEAKEVFVDPDSLDDTEDIGQLIADNEEITVGKDKLALTPRLKKVAEGVLSSVDHMFDSEPELPEEIDWRHYIMAEPDYDESYDYVTLQKLLNAQYKRKRAKYGAGKLLERMTASIPSVEGPAAVSEGGAPPEQPTDGITEATPQNPEANTNSEAGTEGEILKIEMDQPEGASETPELEYEGAAPALTYEPGATEANQGQAGQKQITQQ